MSSISRRERRNQAAQFLKNVADQSFPNSRKIYVPGKIHDIRVGMREITLSDTLIGGGKDNPTYEKNPPLCVYDTSGFYTDDSVDVEFDDANLFVSNRFAGFDRVEGGPRVNYGVKWGVFGAGGGSTSVLVGQSFRFRKDSTFQSGTGLEKNLSDVVARIQVSPNKNLDLTYRTRLDSEDLSPARNEVALSAGVPALQLSADYVKFEREAGSEFGGREEVSGGVRMQLDRFWRTSLSGRYDLEDGGNLRRLGLNLTYECECFVFSATITRSFFEDRDLKPDDAIILRLTFKTLGDVQTGITRSGN